MNKMLRRVASPWKWIPTLYIAEAVPYVAVNSLTVLMYTKLGIGMKDMALYTGWLYLPWVIKPFWSPFVDILGTKRRWVLIMQYLIGLAFAAVAFLLPVSSFFASTLAAFWLIAFCSATHDIAADGYYMIELDQHRQAQFVGVRSTFYRIGTLIGQGGLTYVAGQVELANPGPEGIRESWVFVFEVLSIFFLLITLYHCFFLPKSDRDRPVVNRPSIAGIFKEFGMAFVSFFRKPHILSAVAFMLFYRFPEAMCIKIVQPFLVGSRETGALGMTTSQVGIASGTVGVIALLAGGILGGLAIGKQGLKRWLWPMALSLTLPCVFYCILALTQPEPSGISLFWINAAIFVEQFGYGFGFTAFMLYLIYFSEGPMKTSHYAFCTAFMALGMMVPGMAAGWIFEQLNQFMAYDGVPEPGYVNFFFWIMLSCVATFGVCMTVKIAPHFGIKTHSDK